MEDSQATLQAALPPSTPSPTCSETSGVFGGVSSAARQAATCLRMKLCPRFTKALSAKPGAGEGREEDTSFSLPPRLDVCGSKPRSSASSR